MRTAFLFLLCFLVVPASLSAQSRDYEAENRNLLSVLDEVVAQKDIYHGQREQQIKRLRDQTFRTGGHNRINLYKEIYALYSHYRTDSAHHYLAAMRQMPEAQTDAQVQAYLRIAEAEILAVAGLYDAAERKLDSVDSRALEGGGKELKLFYLRTRRTLYGWMSDYFTAPESGNVYVETMKEYRDSLIALDNPGMSVDIVRADKACSSGNPQAAIDLLLPYVKKMNPEAMDVYVCFTLSQAYKMLDRPAESMYYLLQTAIADIKSGTTEYMALPLLAQRLAESGDAERAYKYLICSMEDAAICKARLRAVEISNIFPIIDKQYKMKELKQKQRTRALTCILVALLVLFSIAIVYLRLQMGKMREMRRQQKAANERTEAANDQLQKALLKLQETNQKLSETYAHLQLADKVKEEYIARYLNRCRGYLDALDEQRRNTLKMLKEHRQDELTKVLKSETQVKKEQESFYADFDAAFLTLFPDFISKFNELLQPGERIEPKREEQLNTELRIFALIRLGITDTAHIAKFLKFSLATVYNYRSKMRNRSNGDPNEFEAKVAEL